MSLVPPPPTRRIEIDRRSANLTAEGDLIKTIQQYCITLVTLLKYTKKIYLFMFISDSERSLQISSNVKTMVKLDVTLIMPL